MDVLVAGAGSLGSLLGGLLAREHDVTLVGREPHVGTVRESGLRIEGAIDARVEPAATTAFAGLEADLAIVAVKAHDTAAVAEELRAAEVDAVLSVQNGLGNEATLADALDAPVLAGTATYGARLVEPGRVACTGVGEVLLGEFDGDGADLAGRVAAAFRAAGIDAAAVPDVPRRTWEKLAVNAGINPVTALARVENGALAGGSDAAVESTVADDGVGSDALDGAGADGADSDGHAPVDGVGSDAVVEDVAATAREAARETARVARARGVDLAPADAVAALDDVVEATAANRSSMLQDVAAGRRTEVDAINGAVVDRAGREDVAVPVNRTLAALVRAWERGQGLR